MSLAYWAAFGIVPLLELCPMDMAYVTFLRLTFSDIPCVGCLGCEGAKPSFNVHSLGGQGWGPQLRLWGLSYQSWPQHAPVAAGPPERLPALHWTLAQLAAVDRDGMGWDGMVACASGRRQRGCAKLGALLGSAPFDVDEARFFRTERWICCWLLLLVV